MQCLVGAAVHEGAEADVVLTAMALARDLADTQGDRAAALLDAGAHEAVGYLDASDLGADGFAVALRRLSSIRAQVDAMLIDSHGRPGRLPV